MRLPFAPLAEAVGDVWTQMSSNYGFQPGKFHHNDFDREIWHLARGNPVTVLSELTGINRRTLTRWVHDGIRDDDADRIACALGFHVCEIWPQWFDDRDSDLGYNGSGRSDVCASPGLPTTQAEPR